MRWNAKLVAGLMVVSISILSITWFVHPKARIGFIAVDGTDEDTLVSIIDGFSLYDDFLDVKIIPESLNLTGIRQKGGNFLVSDFHRLADDLDIRRSYDVDLLVIITERRIQNWDEDGNSRFAYSSHENSSMIMTISFWNLDYSENVTISQRVALRHTFHLLGYPDNSWDEDCIMSGDDGGGSLSLSPYYRVQLPIRLYMFRGMLGQGRFIMNSVTYGAFVALISPFVLASEFTITAIYKRIFGMRRNSFLFYINIAISLIIIFITNGTFLVFTIPPMIMLFTHNGLMTVQKLRKP